jgi:hypothetical protein
MEGLEARLQKRINASLYTLIFLTGLLGLSVLMEGCEVKRQVRIDNSINKDIAVLVLDKATRA